MRIWISRNRPEEVLQPSPLSPLRIYCRRCLSEATQEMVLAHDEEPELTSICRRDPAAMEVPDGINVVTKGVERFL